MGLNSLYYKLKVVDVLERQVSWIANKQIVREQGSYNIGLWILALSVSLITHSTSRHLTPIAEVSMKHVSYTLLLLSPSHPVITNSHSAHS